MNRFLKLREENKVPIEGEIGLNVDDLNYFRGEQTTKKTKTVLPPAMSTISE